MLSKNELKLYRSLHQKKFRKEYNMYLIEGKKGVEEFLSSHGEIISILTTNQQFLEQYPKAIIISKKEMEAISVLKNPTDTLCIAKTPHLPVINFHDLQNKLILILDDLQDPGNLGSIIRIADWFGIETIICSENTVDAYNPKVIQATMGSGNRVNTYYLNLEEFIKTYKKETLNPVYATLLDGENIYQTSINTHAAIVIGNEGNGISETVQNLCTKNITIPRFGKAESLNAGIATALVCAEFRKL